MATWWITDAIPLSATALLPLVLYPALGIMKTRECAPIYVNSTIFLFIGGFMIALTMEKWKLHKRIALWIIRRIGGGPSRIILGFMVAAAFLSMWISNTATAIMMVPIAMAIILQLEERFGMERVPPLHRCSDARNRLRLLARRYGDAGRHAAESVVCEDLRDHVPECRAYRLRPVVGDGVAHHR